MDVLRIVLITYLVLYFTNNLPRREFVPRAPKESRTPWWNRRISFGTKLFVALLYVTAGLIALHH